MPTTASILSAYATITTFTMLIRKVLNEIWTSVEWLIPQQVREKILAKLKCLSRDLSSQMTITIDEYVGDSMNEIYRDSEIYLRMRIPPSVKRLRAFKSPREKKLSLTFHNGEKISDEFEGIQLKWQLGTPDDRNGDEYENQSFLLSFDSKHTEKVTSGYLEFIQKTVQATKKEDKPNSVSGLGIAACNRLVEHFDLYIDLLGGALTVQGRSRSSSV
ncbi:hypothetical protein L1049_006280 [Liquidambar formosana]|uniref:AAA-type ATPase N-terminal domain-containing protein n=1 Tax=Liquidambar formosana TaxID=63359 RepID=A0AAP0WR83_LIQFO